MSAKLNTRPMREWLDGAERPVLISGPCSAETEDQVMEAAMQLSKLGKVNILRAGIWKPRTRPNSFEGVGEPGLHWLKNAGNEIGVPVATEVANAAHVEACLKAGVDILWIGARTTVNPFSVQEIADAVKGVDIPVFVKNPINPDLQLWIGAMERIRQSGIDKMVAIHRGFSSHEPSAFRNAPMWEIPIELKRRFPDLEVICDPSHIAGNRELLGMISQKAMDLAMDGLMIESHPNPAQAMSDAKQQVTADALDQILNELVVRHEEVGSGSFRDQLTMLRGQIDGLDEKIIQDICARMDVAEEIGLFKRDNDVTILQVNRWEEIMRKRTKMGQAMGLSEDFMTKFLQLVHKESIRRQTAVMNKETQEN